jgi:membrane-associated PAP2 superfamily phosphatase
MQLAVGTLAAAASVSLLKGFSATSCPWDLQHYGGVASYVPHWTRGADGGAGHCFPAGHAASGFAFVSGGFAFREHEPRIARLWLLAALAAGLLLGLAQQWRGAHFMSHTLWTAWTCLAVAWAIDRSCGSRRSGVA